MLGRRPADVEMIKESTCSQMLIYNKDKLYFTAFVYKVCISVLYSNVIVISTALYFWVPVVVTS